MGELAQQAAIVFGVLAACFVGPGVAIGSLVLRKRRARARRRSPIGIDLLRGPGHTLREQLDDATNDMMADCFVLMVMPLLLLAVSLAQGHVRGVPEMMRLAPLYALLTLGFVVVMVRKLWKAGERLDNLKAGYDAELAVGQELDRLMRQGAAVFHDIPADNFNIDHVVVSSAGVFAVETKGYTKPKQGRGRPDATVVFDGNSLKFPMWTTREPLEQAERQAAWLTTWVSSAVGTRILVLPVLALPGWFVERTGRCAVRVFNGKELAGLLASHGTQALSAQEVQQVVHQIDQRCRTVSPRYNEEKKAS